MDIITEKKLENLNRLKLLLAKKKRTLAEKSFSRFVKFFLAKLTTHKTPDFHLEIMTLLEELIAKEKVDKIHRLLFIAPRGFAKSHICSIFFPLWLACYGFRKDIFIVSATISLAEAHLRKIRAELENNEEIIRAFGDLRSDKWTEQYLVLKNGVEIRAKGRGFQIRGFRPDMIICDDLEDEEVIYSKEQREKLEHWFFRTLLPALKPNQDLVYIGTKIHQFSLISKLEEKKEFIKKKFPALVNGKSIWEELFPTSFLKKLRTEIGTYAFESEYQNNPISLEEQPIKPHYLEGVRIGGKMEIKAMAIDPAISEKTTSDYRAITIFGRSEEGFRELFSDRGRWSLNEQVDKIISFYKNFKPDRVLIEEVAFQKVFRQILLDKARSQRIYIPVSTAELGVGGDKRPKDKLTRLMEIIHIFEQRLVEIVNPELKQELLAFPYGDYDDMVDATVYALYWLVNFKKGGGFRKKEEMKLIDSKPSYYVQEVRPGVYVAKVGVPPIKIKTNFINYDKN